jgi:hypothetical protein
MNRKCKQCGGIIGSVPETTCACLLLRADMGAGKQFVATQKELSTIIEILRNEVRSAMQDGMNKKQQQVIGLESGEPSRSCHYENSR